jgi:hypothetical protein
MKMMNPNAASGGPQWQTQGPSQGQQSQPQLSQFMGALSGRLMGQAPRMGQGGFNMFQPQQPQGQQQNPFMNALSSRLMSQAPRMGQGGFNMFRPQPRPNTASPWASAFQSQIPMMRGNRFPMGFG